MTITQHFLSLYLNIFTESKAIIRGIELSIPDGVSEY
jgi:hypothetical protein